MPSQYSRRGVLKVGAGAALSTLVGVDAVSQAAADQGAADAIQGWSRQLTPGTQYMLAQFTATQAANPVVGSMSVDSYCSTLVMRASDSSLQSPSSSELFSDRYFYTTGTPVELQPFDASRSDQTQFTLTLAGHLLIASITWGGTDDITLQDLGNGLLGGWGASIGNRGIPAFWIVAVDPRVQTVPG